MNSSFNEVCIESPDGQLMCALINGGQGWLMYLREAGDAGFSSRNPDYTGAKNATIVYRLSNGQEDLYPASWAYPVEHINRAIEYFKEFGRPPPFITWHNDSEDGTVIGDSVA